ncbi:hypothetical protein SDJN02_03562, partial [Cucurbita argyrosperma subsp. argyrosperma]
MLYLFLFFYLPFLFLTIFFSCSKQYFFNEILSRISFRERSNEGLYLSNSFFICKVLIESIRRQYQESVGWAEFIMAQSWITGDVRSLYGSSCCATIARLSPTFIRSIRAVESIINSDKNPTIILRYHHVNSILTGLPLCPLYALTADKVIAIVFLRQTGLAAQMNTALSLSCILIILLVSRNGFGYGSLQNPNETSFRFRLSISNAAVRRPSQSSRSKPLDLSGPIRCSGRPRVRIRTLSPLDPKKGIHRNFPTSSGVAPAVAAQRQRNSSNRKQPPDQTWCYKDIDRPETWTAALRRWRLQRRRKSTGKWSLERCSHPGKL